MYLHNLSEQEHLAVLNAINFTIKAVGADQGLELLTTYTQLLGKLSATPPTQLELKEEEKDEKEENAIPHIG